MAPEFSWIGSLQVVCAIAAVVLSVLSPHIANRQRIRSPLAVLWATRVQLALSWSDSILQLKPLFQSHPLDLSAYDITFFAIATSIQSDRLFEDPSCAWKPYVCIWCLGLFHETVQVTQHLSPDVRHYSGSVIKLALAVAKIIQLLILISCFILGSKDGYISVPQDEKSREFNGPSDLKPTLRAHPDASESLHKTAAEEVRDLGFWSWVLRFRIMKQFIWPADRPGLRWRLVLLFGLKLVEEGLGILDASIFGGLLDGLFRAETWRDILLPTLKLAISRFALSNVGLPCLTKWLWLDLITIRQQKLQTTVYNTLMRADSSYHNSIDPTALSLVIDRAEGIDQMFDSILNDMIPSVIAAFLTTPFLVAISGSATLLDLTICSTFVGIILRRSTGRVLSSRGMLLGADSHQKQQRQDTIRGWRTAANYNQLGYQVEENNKRVAAVFSLQWRFFAIVFKAYSLMDLELHIGCAAGMLLVICRVLNGNATPGAVFAYPMYWNVLSKPLERLRISTRDILKKLQEADTMRKLLEQETKKGPELPKLEVRKGELEFRNITFLRGKQIVLENSSICIIAGTKTALVGPSGVGKSTLLALLMGQEKPDSGQILIDNQNIEEVDIDSVRDHVGIIEQDPFIFNCSVRENLQYAKRDATDDEIREALQQAFLDDTVSQRPKKYDTPAGVNGRNFSGGEKQKLGLARLFLKSPSIALIDEGTSALDVETEYLIKASISKTLCTKTCIIAAHRLSSIMDADDIVVLGDKGRIVERGTHKLLLERMGKYWELWQRQIGQ